MKSTYLVPLACVALSFACANVFADTHSTADADRPAMESRHITHRDFDAVDTHKRGYLTSEDVRKDEWVHKNFARCNERRDGHMSREEYAKCHE
jgi:hypothetical protein